MNTGRMAFGPAYDRITKNEMALMLFYLANKAAPQDNIVSVLGAVHDTASELQKMGSIDTSSGDRISKALSAEITANIDAELALEHMRRINP